MIEAIEAWRNVVKGVMRWWRTEDQGISVFQNVWNKYPIVERKVSYHTSAIGFYTLIACMHAALFCPAYVPKWNFIVKTTFTYSQFKCNLKLLKVIHKLTSLPYFEFKLSCVCLMFAYRKKSNDLSPIVII